MKRKKDAPETRRHYRTGRFERPTWYTHRAYVRDITFGSRHSVVERVNRRPDGKLDMVFMVPNQCGQLVELAWPSARWFSHCIRDAGHKGCHV